MMVFNTDSADNYKYFYVLFICLSFVSLSPFTPSLCCRNFLSALCEILFVSVDVWQYTEL